MYGSAVASECTESMREEPTPIGRGAPLPAPDPVAAPARRGPTVCYALRVRCSLAVLAAHVARAIRRVTATTTLTTTLTTALLAGQAYAQDVPTPPPAADAAVAGEGFRAVTRIEHRPAGVPPTLGPPDAPVQVELFFLPGASSSRAPYQLAMELWRSHPTRVRVVFRVLSRHGQYHLPAAALEAAAQGKFFPFMEAVATRLRGALPAQIREVAQAAELDVERLDAAWNDNRHVADLDANELRRTRLRARQIPDVLFSGKLTSRPVTLLGGNDFEAAYREAYERAQDALDRGVAPGDLAAWLERAVQAERAQPTVSLGPTDDRSEDDDAVRSEPGTTLLLAPVASAGLPVLREPRLAPTAQRPDATWPPQSSPDDRRPAPVLVACNPLSVLCYRQLQIASATAGLLEHRVRVLWAPLFDPRARDAINAARASDAILCAEVLGGGWAALDILTAQTNRRRGRIIEPERIIDDLIAEADLDGPRLAACLAARAGESVRRVEELRSAGLSVTPTVVVGGRMYPGGVSPGTLQALVEHELAEGWLGQLSVEP